MSKQPAPEGTIPALRDGKMRVGLGRGRAGVRGAGEGAEFGPAELPQFTLIDRFTLRTTFGWSSHIVNRIMIR